MGYDYAKRVLEAKQIPPRRQRRETIRRRRQDVTSEPHKKPWFKPNRAGPGYHPSTWQGGLILIIAVVVLVVIVYFLLSLR